MKKAESIEEKKKKKEDNCHKKTPEQKVCYPQIAQKNNQAIQLRERKKAAKHDCKKIQINQT